MRMARPLRIEFANALYHVTARGNERRDIFFDTRDREAFLDGMAASCDRFNWLCHGYCLMSNHYHLLIETPDGNLSAGMRHVNGCYTQQINRRHGRVGHLFQGRFKGILVEKDSYLLELARYIVLNPVRAGMVASPADWPWSSYRQMIGQEPLQRFLTRDWLLSTFGPRRSEAQARYARFVADGIGQPSPWDALKAQVFLGSDRFVEKMLQHVKEDQSLLDIPSAQQRAPAKALHFYAQTYPDRAKAMAMAYRTGAYTFEEIGRHFGVSRMTVSRAVKQHGK